MKRKLKYLKVDGEPVYIVINDEVLKKCWRWNTDGYITLPDKENIIYLPTKKHIQKYIIKHEYHHLLHKKELWGKRHLKNIPKTKIQWWNRPVLIIDNIELQAILYEGSIYKENGIFYFKEYYIKKMKESSKHLKEEYLKLKRKENAAKKEIDI